MSFDQGHFNFDAPGSEAGYQKWQQELEEKKRDFELRFGVMIGRRVRVQLVGETDPLEGMIYLVSQKIPQSAAKLKLSMGKREFTPLEIESIVRLDAS
jgi:hypothetical protein